MGPHKRVPRVRLGLPGVLFQRESRGEGVDPPPPPFCLSRSSSRAWPTRRGREGVENYSANITCTYITAPRARVHVVRWGRWSRIAFLSFPFQPTNQRPRFSSLLSFNCEGLVHPLARVSREDPVEYWDSRELSCKIFFLFLDGI